MDHIAPRAITLNLEDHRPTLRAYVVSLVLHVSVIALVLIALMRPSRPAGAAGGAAGSQQHGIAAFVMSTPRPTGTSGLSQMPAKKIPAPYTMRAKPTSNADRPGSEGAADSNGAGNGASSSAPVRLGSGEGLGLIKKVQPVYPRQLEVARTEGIVVVDAIIHRDGTVGDIRVLRSTAVPFEQAAIAALKQWRYNPLPYEGIATVTFNFTMAR